MILLDDRQPGATAAGMGHLVCMDDDPAELALSAWSLGDHPGKDGAIDKEIRHVLTAPV